MSGRALLAATILGSSLAFIDGSVVNVALPSIQHALQASPAATQWLINAYMLPLGALVLIGGALADRYGRRRIFVAGLCVFATASLAAAFAPSIAWLLAARAAQGAGAALLTPASLAMLGAGFDGPARGRAIGTWAAVGAITGAVGPVIGGWLVDTAGWRSIFFVNLPLAAAALWIAIRHVEETRDTHAPARLDWAGAAIATAGLGALAWGLTEFSAHGPAASSIAALIVGMVLLAGFVWLESRLGTAAMMPMMLFMHRDFVGVTLLTLCLYAAMGGLVVLLPYLLIRVAHFDATAAGAAVLPVPIVIGLASRTIGHLAERTGPRLPLTAGPLVVGVGFAWLAAASGGALDYASTILPPLLVIACGMAMAVAPLTTTVMTSVNPDHVGSASGVNNAVARIASLLAVALCGTLFAAGDDTARFMHAFVVAAWGGAVLAIAAAACGFTMIRNKAP